MIHRLGLQFPTATLLAHETVLMTAANAGERLKQIDMPRAKQRAVTIVTPDNDLKQHEAQTGNRRRELAEVQ